MNYFAHRLHGFHGLFEDNMNRSALPLSYHPQKEEFLINSWEFMLRRRQNNRKPCIIAAPYQGALNLFDKKICVNLWNLWRNR